MKELKEDFEKSGGEWKEYKICGENGIFDVRNTHSIQQTWIEFDSGKYPYVTASEANNSVVSYISYDEDCLEKGNSIMIGGKTLVITYQEDDYFSNDSHNLALYVKDERCKSKLCQLFLVSALYKSLKPKYSWGDSISYKKIQNDSFFLPTVNGEIAFSFMESCIRELEEERIRELAAYLKAVGLDDYTIVRGGAEDKALDDFRNGKIAWKKFKIEELFMPLKGRRKLSKLDFNDTGKVPVYSSNSTNNGICGYTSLIPDYVIDEQCPVYIVFGDHTRTMNIAQSNFCVMDNVKVLIPKFNNINIILYLITVWRKMIPNLGYARHWSVAKKSILNLPVTTDGEIDFEFMQNFITAQEKLVIKGVVEWKDKIIDTTKNVINNLI